MNSAPLDATDLQQALDGRFPYHLLSASLQQRLSQQEYYAYTVKHGILRWYPYHRLPDFVKPTMSEAAYYEMMVQYGGEQLQLYPYVHLKQILYYTRETPLTYYTRMIAELLKAERSYDRLPNFTANDILNLLGIGRNQYLNVTKEVRSKLRWHVNRNYVPEHLPNEFLPSVTLDPFWSLVPVLEAPSQQAQQLERVSKLCRAHPEDAALFRLLATKASGGSYGASSSRSNFTLSASFSQAGSTDQQLLEGLQVDCRAFASEVVYACQAPYEAVHRLYRKGLLCADFTVAPEDIVVVPPLGSFVMNRTSEEPLELLLYRVLSTLDDRTPLQLLAQLLMVAEEDVCAAVHALIRLALARRKTVRVPDAIARDTTHVHVSWQPIVAPLLAASTASRATNAGLAAGAGESGDVSDGGSRVHRLGSEPTRTSLSEAEVLLPESNPASPTEMHPNDGAFATGVITAPTHKRIALLYDATLTGFLMMTNLNRDPVFKQLAVTLFEVGKMPDEMIGSFLDLLEKIDPSESKGFGGEAQKYIQSAISLRELLRALRSVRAPDGDGPCGVDMLKIESLNELEATTRYSVLGRNYWAYITTAPIATAPLIDIELSCVYGNTASLMASPWLLFFLYETLRHGPPTLMLPFGSQLHSWPPEFHDLQEPPPRTGFGEGKYHHGLEESAGAVEAEHIDCSCASDLAVEGYAAQVRLQTITLDAEVSHADMDTSLLLVNEMAVTAPVVVQCVARVPLVTASVRGRRDGVVMAEQQSHGFFEVAVPFTATVEEVQSLLSARAAEDLVGGSDGTLLADNDRLPPLADEAAPPEEVFTATAAGETSVAFLDNGGLVYRTLERCVDALHLRDSLGYLTLCVSFHAHSDAVDAELRGTSPPPRSTTHVVDHVDVVGIGLGLSLTHGDCCTCAIRALPRLLTEEASERHNAAMRHCAEAFGAFLERHSTLTQASYGKLALRSAGVTGPMTLQHLRKVGGGGAAPFPSTTLLFTGTELLAVDDSNPLSEQWSIG